ncbi:cell division protein FtsZ [Mycoplasma corogypsi]|uniref:cell division protein FtsZ n=1 Tax=Mycoplasma corogypsi TaxID=2106 RepID=UPI003873A995
MSNKYKPSQSQAATDELTNPTHVVFKVIGVGGVGSNAVANIMQENLENVEFLVANTDLQSLNDNSCENKIHLGDARGLGAGANPEVGEKAALDKRKELEEHLRGTDLLIITAGLGGGTGSGASPVIAQIAKELGILTIALVYTPFKHEGSKKRKIAQESLQELKKHVDSYIVVSNRKLSEQCGDLPFNALNEYGNIALKNIILAIHDIIYRTGKINIDFADVETIVKDSGLAVVGIGQATGNDKAEKAVQKAFENYVFENDISTAQRLIINIQHDNKTSLKEIERATLLVSSMFNIDDENEEDQNIIFGQEEVETRENEELFKISIIATGVDERSVNSNRPSQPPFTVDSTHQPTSYTPQPQPVQPEVKTYVDSRPQVVQNSYTEAANTVYQQPAAQETVAPQPTLEQFHQQAFYSVNAAEEQSSSQPEEPQSSYDSLFADEVVEAKVEETTHETSLFDLEVEKAKTEQPQAESVYKPQEAPVFATMEINGMFSIDPEAKKAETKSNQSSEDEDDITW